MLFYGWWWYGGVEEGSRRERGRGTTSHKCPSFRSVHNVPACPMQGTNFWGFGGVKGAYSLGTRGVRDPRCFASNPLKRNRPQPPYMQASGKFLFRL